MNSNGKNNSIAVVKQEAGLMKIQFFGSIDENFEFPSFDKVPALVQLDLSKVTGINSRGIRDWIDWISRFINTRLELHQCPKLIIDQINMVQDFVPSAALVMSFFVPYYCEDSEEEKQVLFKRGTEFEKGQVNPPANVKDSAGNTMEIDVIESKFFQFLYK